MFPRGGASNLTVVSFPIGGLIKSNIGSPSPPVCMNHTLLTFPLGWWNWTLLMLPIAGPSKPKARTFPIDGLLKTYSSSYSNRWTSKSQLCSRSQWLDLPNPTLLTSPTRWIIKSHIFPSQIAHVPNRISYHIPHWFTVHKQPHLSHKRKTISNKAPWNFPQLFPLMFPMFSTSSSSSPTAVSVINCFCQGSLPNMLIPSTHRLICVILLGNPWSVFSFSILCCRVVIMHSKVERKCQSFITIQASFYWHTSYGKQMFLLGYLLIHVLCMECMETHRKWLLMWWELPNLTSTTIGIVGWSIVV